MILEQIYLGCLSQASYLIGDSNSGIAAVVDPRRDIDEYLALAEQHGLEIKHAILTHFHADFASGHLELSEQCDATIYLGHGASPDYPFHALADGATIEFGSVRIETMSTPGHTPESISLLVFDLDEDPQNPAAVLTGDTLFIGDAGRPDLLGAQGLTAEQMAGQLYDSLRNRLMTLPAATIVYPGHGAGSMCGKNLSTETVSTIGEQLQTNCALKPMDRGEFVAMITANQPQTPGYFPYDVDFNKRQHATLAVTRNDAMQTLSLSQFLEARDTGSVVLDTRSADDYAAKHLHKSINVGLGGKFATWCGTVLEVGRPIVLITDPGTENEVVTRLGRIGFDQVRGYLEGGIGSLIGHQDLTESARITADRFEDHLKAHPGSFLLDVRNPNEFAAGAMDDAVLIPLRDLAKRMDEVPTDRHVAIYCGSGYRSAIAMGFLQAHGVSGMSDLVGGWTAWAARA